MYLGSELIKKTRNKVPLTSEEIQWLVRSFTDGSLPEYQMSAWLMAVFFSGLSARESADLTGAMLSSGEVVNHEGVERFKVDKHSTGGVGDKTSLILGPIVAAAGLAVPMISGRGLGHTGGTLDKLESIPGFNTQISVEQFKDMVKNIGISFIGQTKEICPADKKMYALRDVTATVESIPLITASIMSKKLAEGIDGLVLDVKFGSGAFMKTLDSSKSLAKSLIETAQIRGKKITAVLSSMDQPLGRFAGNSLEVFECLEVLRGQSYLSSTGRDLYADTRYLSVFLAAHMLFLANEKTSFSHCFEQCESVIRNGKALAKFEELVTAHGGRLTELPQSRVAAQVFASASGYIHSFNVEAIGVAGIHLGAGRAKNSDTIEPSAGIEIHKKISDKVILGECLFTVYAPESLSETKLQNCLEWLSSCYSIGESAIIEPSLIAEVLK
jgi:pyrimidine-nucleoside phosphorylase